MAGTLQNLIVCLQAAAHYQNAVDLDLAGTAARTELALVHAVRKHLAEGNAVLDNDPRQAQWYADLAARQLSPALLEPAHMLRCKVRCTQQKWSCWLHGHFLALA